jgi:hypothetical protein
MSERDILDKIVRGILIVVIGTFVLGGLVLGACFLALSR